MRIPTLIVALALLGVLLPAAPAAACSCAEATLDDVVARHPDVAVALVRRVDDGARRAVGALDVVAELHGELPGRVSVALDDGASCRPMLAPRQLATLSFRPSGGGWEAVDCGMLDDADALGRLFGPLAPDPEAAGPASLVAAGSFPGADLVALDAELRVLAVADVDGWIERLVACGDDLVTFRMEDPTWVVERWSLTDLTRTASSRVDRPGGWQVLAARCDDAGRVQAVAVEDLPGGTGLVHRDLLGAPADVLEVPLAGGATFVDEHAWLVVSDNDGRTARIDTVDLTTGEVATRRMFDGLAASEVVASPDGRFATLRGFAEEPVLVVLDTATATPVAQRTGWWMPLSGGWLADGRLLLHDESSEMGTRTPLRVVDERLRVLEEVTLPGGRPLALAGEHLVVGGGTELGVRRPDGSLHQSRDLRLVAARQALALGEVRGPAEVAPVATPVATPAPARSSPATWQLALATVATVAVVTALVVLRRRRRDRP
ncbi:MAG: hypothetical protein KY461_12515 [Actinobacteria bacterium]|nr:hypothetical protein [Actinomycetota bacterium]